MPAKNKMNDEYLTELLGKSRVRKLNRFIKKKDVEENITIKDEICFAVDLYIQAIEDTEVREKYYKEMM